MADRKILPAVINQKVAVQTEQRGSLVMRGLVAVQVNKGLALTKDNDALYREARDVYNRIAGEGIDLGDWSTGELAELKKAFEAFYRLADEQYGKAYLPLSMIYYVYRYYQWRNDDSHHEYEELAHHYVHLAFEWCANNQYQNDPEIWNDLGTLYRNELGTLYWNEETIETNYEMAHYWFQKAAMQGFTYAQYNLGLMYGQGQGVTQDYKTAAEWYQKAAMGGYVDAQINLGEMYRNGKGVPQDDEQAAYWLREAAEQSALLHMPSLRVKDDNGKGVPQDDADPTLIRPNSKWPSPP